MTDILFESVQYLAGNSDGATKRTQTQRTGEIFNVKDYGAVGSGSNIDTSAIQAAITAALAVSFSGSTKGAVVYFPPGEYKVDAPLNFPPTGGAEVSVSLVGSGATASTIIGNVAGYIINKPDDGVVTLKAIEGLYISNQSTSIGSGGIRIDRAGDCALLKLQVQAVNALHLGGSDSGFVGLTSISNASPAVFTKVGHGQRIGQSIALYNTRRIFTVTAANATSGATYQDDFGQVFTVVTTITGGTTLVTTSAAITAAPHGTVLTKTAGTGDATITFSTYITGLPASLLDSSAATHYYYIIAAGFTANAFQVSTAPSGAAVNTTTAETGTSQILPHNNVFCISVTDCVITSPTTSGTTGYYGALCGQTEFYNTTFAGWDIGLVHSNVGLIFHGSRIESSNKAIQLGDDIQFGAATNSHSASIVGNSFERNNVTIHALICSALSIDANSITGNTSVDGLGTPITGLLMGTVTAAKISANTFSLTASNACIDLSACDGQNVVFVGNNGGTNSGGPVWKMPVFGVAPAKTLYEVHYIGNDNPTSAFPFAALPPSPVEGMEFDITDGTDGLGWGVTATGTGTHTTHYLVRYNGTNWTVVGK